MLLALVSALGLAGSSTASDWSLRLLADAAKTDGALCLDGSAPGYYIRPGVGADAKKFKMHFKGGGWYVITCFNAQSSISNSPLSTRAHFGCHSCPPRRPHNDAL